MGGFDTIERLRKAPKRERERLVALVTIVSVALITAIWFAFTVPTFFRQAPRGSSGTAQTLIKPAIAP